MLNYVGLSDDINKAMEVEGISLYICLDQTLGCYAKWTELDTMNKFGEFEYVLNPRPSVGDDVLLRSQATGFKDDEGYEIWKIIKILDRCLGINSGRFLLKYITTTCYIPGER